MKDLALAQIMGGDSQATIWRGQPDFGICCQFEAFLFPNLSE